VAMHIQRDEAHPYLLSLDRPTQKRRTKRQLRIPARGTPGQSQGRPTTNDGLAAHSVSDGQPNLVSPQSPRPGTTSDANPASGRTRSMRRSSSPHNHARPHPADSPSARPTQHTPTRQRAAKQSSAATDSADSSTNTTAPQHEPTF